MLLTRQQTKGKYYFAFYSGILRKVPINMPRSNLIVTIIKNGKKRDIEIYEKISEKEIKKYSYVTENEISIFLSEARIYLAPPCIETVHALKKAIVLNLIDYL